MQSSEEARTRCGLDSVDCLYNKLMLVTPAFHMPATETHKFAHGHQLPCQEGNLHPVYLKACWTMLGTGIFVVHINNADTAVTEITQ